MVSISIKTLYYIYTKPMKMVDDLEAVDYWIEISKSFNYFLGLVELTKIITESLTNDKPSN